VSTLQIAHTLALPLEFVVQKSALLARSGAGKTNTAVVIAEELLEAKQQVVILDPPGAWWGLRSSADGKRAGYPIVVFGGIHGDLPLQSTSGELLADLVVDQGLSAPQWRILAALIQAYPAAVDRVDLAAEAGQSHASSGYANNLGHLRGLGLVTKKGPIAATDLLFPVGLQGGGR
jgi:DNA helicase HerA-like ATPase